MASHVSDTWHAMCQHAWHTLKAKNIGSQIQFVGGGGGGGGGGAGVAASFSPWEQQ